MASDNVDPAHARQLATVSTAVEAGLLGGTKSNIGARVPERLLEEARSRSGIRSTTELLEYALTKVALEDDFGVKLVARKGRIPRDLAI